MGRHSFCFHHLTKLKGGKAVVTSTSIEIGKRICALRKARGLTQEGLARELGVTRSCISNWENGSREPGFEWWGPLSTYFDVSVNYLCAGQKPGALLPFDLERLNPEGQELLKQFYAFLTGLPQYKSGGQGKN